MATTTLKNPYQPELLIPSAQLATLLFVATELMFFMALVSAYLVIRAESGILWVPPPQVALPVAATAVNTAFLLGSGVLFFFSGRAFVRREPVEKSKRLFLLAIVLGTVFVVVQGCEWVRLLSLGMTMASGVFGACFFLLIGSHGIHVLGALIAMLYTFYRLHLGLLTLNQFRSMQIFWYFVVGVWPLLYGLVYF